MPYFDHQYKKKVWPYTLILFMFMVELAFFNKKKTQTTLYGCVAFGALENPKVGVS
jgi:hypothetical protein